MTPIRRLSEALLATSHLLARVELFFCQILIVAFSTLLLVNVTLRYTLSSPIYFAEELAVYILIWMAFLAIAATIARREMIALTFIADKASPRLRLWVDVLVDLIVLCMVTVLAWVSWRWLQAPAMQYEQALTLGMVKKPFYAIVPIFFTLATFHTAINLLRHLALPRDIGTGNKLNQETIQ